VRTNCTVSFTDPDGLRHSVNVQAETLYEAVALAVQAFREHQCAPTPMSAFEVEARSPAVLHTVTMRMAPVVGEEPGGSDYEGTAEGDDGVVKGKMKRDAAATNAGGRSLSNCHLWDNQTGPRTLASRLT
jgi:hypothetical protein